MHHPRNATTPRPAPARARRCAGLSLAEMLVSLVIIAVLLTAVTVALDASFRAYAQAAESAGTQTSTRMVTQRILSLVRNGVAQAPVALTDFAERPDADDPADIGLGFNVMGVERPVPGTTDDTFVSSWLAVATQNGSIAVLRYFEDQQELRYYEFPIEENIPRLSDDDWIPLLGGVTECRFTVLSRIAGYANRRERVMRRASMALTVQPDVDTSLAVEQGSAQPIQVLATTAPRRLDPN